MYTKEIEERGNEKSKIKSDVYRRGDHNVM